MADKGVKLSKSKSNTKISLTDALRDYGADVIRYWCANGAYGRDVFFSDTGLKDGYKLLNKVWNASKFVLSFLYDYTPEKPANILPLDRHIMHKFNECFERTYNFYEKVEMGYAKDEIEKFFWYFCDNYIEIAKNRLYKPEVYGEDAKRSAQWACYNVLLHALQLLSITMPHITEEIYQEYFKQFEKVESIHMFELKKLELKDDAEILSNGDTVVDIVGRIRQFKSLNQLSMKTEIDYIEIVCDNINFVKSCEADIKAVTSVREVKYSVGEFDVKIGNPIIEEK
jgi:valyl-tRNA synthetase